MELKIQIPDNAYQLMMARKCRIRGSIGLVTPTRGNFNVYTRRVSEREAKYIRLRHGRVSVAETHVRLTLYIGLDEAEIIPAEVIETESREAGEFVDEILANIERYH